MNNGQKDGIDSNTIPLMFRAQVEGRSQIQRLIPGELRQQAYDWTDEWIEGASKEVPQFGPEVRTKEYKITWRMVANSGQDEGVIRPVIGAKGWPFYPGASMKGAFLRACTDQEALKYCGGQVSKKETQPGILRFHGGFPKEWNWTEKPLVDVVHPQQEWQIEAQARHSAFIQISLYQPTLVFGISSSEALDESQWQRIWQIWQTALERGIGSRVSAGYGQTRVHGSSKLLSVGLQGQGLASQLVNKIPEFRPNMFKSALRGHTLRLFSGITDEKTAQTLTKELWGGLNGKKGAIVGLLGVAFNPIELDLTSYTYRNNEMPIYELFDGMLTILVMRSVSEKQKKNLRIFVTQLVKFAMLLGGFGKSWRRVDHRLVFPNYLIGNANPMIGCHWEFTERSERFYCPVNHLSDLTDFLTNLDKNLKGWLKLKKKKPSNAVSNWREAWHPGNVQVWGRITRNQSDSEAVRWFHGPYRGEKSIKGTELTGRLNRIGRIWHRMYPRYITTEDGTPQATGEYVELLTIFPDNSNNTQEFLKFLATDNGFSKL
ncbi:MAG: hypothetical protein F6J92_18950 [Symploca sp. SIO1A3]|nr:hypothetical protein [Symploca sp. SIO1A3]